MSWKTTCWKTASRTEATAFVLALCAIALCWGVAGTVLAQTAAAQTGVIAGTVTDAESGQTLPGASVRLVGVQQGTSTGPDGEYVIPDVAPGTYAVRASYVGYEAQTEEDVEVRAGETATVDFVLSAGVALEEVVVVGYGTTERENLTTAISSIGSEDIENRAITNAAAALQGKVAGVTVTQNSGSPGSGFSVRIRGISSPGNNEPLYVVDGLPLPDRPEYLTPNDIESMDVVKDAAGAAIYGTQGSNGVVFITTKKGRAGQTQVTFNAQAGMSETARRLDLLEAAEYATLRNEASINAGQAPVFENPTALRGTGTDYQDQIFQNGAFQNYSLAVSGGAEEFSFRVGGDFTDEMGIVRGSDNRRINFRVNTEFRPSELLRIGENLSIGRTSRNTLPEDDDVRNFLIQTLQFSPTEPVLYQDGSYSFSSFGNNAFNPVAVIDFRNAEDRATRIAGNVFAELTPVEGLSLESDFGLDLRYGDSYGFTPMYNVSPEFSNAINSVSRYSDRRTSMIWSNTATYQQVFGERHDTEFLGGVSTEWNTYEFISASAQAIPNNEPSLRYLQQGTGEQGATGDFGESRLLSFFGRANYNYDERYLLTAVARYDGSSRFGENNRFGFFPSFSAAWRLSEEDFFEDVNYVSNLKLRGGYGINGNDQIGDFLFLTGIEGFRNYITGNAANLFPGATITGSGNPDLQWEESRQLNIGLDASLFEGRLTATAEYFVENTVDLLLGAPQLATSGSQLYGQVQNAGDVQNRGFELALGYSDEAGVFGRDFTYDLSANLATVTNEVKSLGESAQLVGGTYRQGNITRSVVGEPLGSFYGYVTDGLFQTQDEVDAANELSEDGDETPYQDAATAPGDIRFQDLNDDGIINDDDRTFIGNPFPDFTYGLTATLGYGGFDMNVFLQGVSGNEIFAAYEYYTLGSGIFNLEEDALNRYTGPGSSTDMPRLTVDDPNQNTRISDRFVEDGSYLRLRNLTIGYTLPAGLFDSVGAPVGRARIWVGGQNLLTFTGYGGYDPEIGEGLGGVLDRGIDRGTYPQARTYTVGVDLRF